MAEEQNVSADLDNKMQDMVDQNRQESEPETTAPAENADTGQEESEDPYQELGFSEEQISYLKQRDDDFDKMKRTMEEKEKFNQRQASELGELRKAEQRMRELEQREQMAELQAKNADYYTDQEQYDAAQRGLAQVQYLKQLEQQQLQLQQLRQRIPEIDTLMKDEIPGILQNVWGARPEEVPALMNDIRKNPQTVAQLGHLARQHVKTKKVEKEKQELMEKMKSMSSNLANPTSDGVVTSRLPAQKGGTKDFSKMTDAELDAILNGT